LGSFSYSNPLGFVYNVDESGPHQELRDPCITRYEDSYYLVFTVYPFAGRSNEQMGDPNQGSSPGIALFESQNLTEWRFKNWLVKSSEPAIRAVNGPSPMRYQLTV